MRDGRQLLGIKSSECVQPPPLVLNTNQIFYKWKK